jgi:16S rRNA C967 or C1407 C5-methylase (RsmB/RsmF family)/NOL1/NOP2/fmu family ribosome biogenesis protein
MTPNFPEGFIDHLKNTEGFDEPKFIEAHSNQPELSIRLHPRKGKGIFSNNQPVKWCAEGKYLTERPDFTLDPLFHAGAYYVQEASSMSIFSVLEELFPSTKEINILDLCAAPGGKSTLIASWLDGEGLLVSNEVIRSRAGILKENLDRWGYANVVVSNNDPRQFGKLAGIFDVAFVDAPCSGSGMFRKDLNAMNHWSLDAVDHCAARQKRILSDIWPSIKQGGYLVYSTCSYSLQEDEEICEWLQGEENAELIPIKSFEEFPEIIKSEFGHRFYPDKIKGEGFFIALIQKKENTLENILKPAKIRDIPKETASFIIENSNLKLHYNHLGECVINEYSGEFISTIEKHLHIIKCGIKLGELKGKTFVPDHELAMSVLLNPEFQTIELTKDEALRYLKKEALPNNSGKTGWTKICFEGRTLGWGNALPNRINNGLPKSWRIRKDID